MFNRRARESEMGQPQAFIRLRAATAFPTDARLLERIEASRKALPLDNVKPVRRPKAEFEVMLKAS